MRNSIPNLIISILRSSLNNSQKLITKTREYNQLNFYNVKLTQEDSTYIYRLKGISILTVVLGHLGLGWILRPHCTYINLVIPLFFLCSGYLLPSNISKQGNTLSFWFKRIWNLVFPFYLIYFTALTLSTIISGDFMNFNLPHLGRMLILAPLANETPYPLGQLWFLRVLLFVILVSPFILFIRDKIGNIALTIPVIVATLLSAVENTIMVHSFLFYSGHSLYQEIVYGSFYFIGTILACLNWRKKKFYILLFAISTSLGAIYINLLLQGSLDLSQHSYAPDTYYFLLSISFISGMLLAEFSINRILEIVTPLRWLLEYSGKVSYSLFLIHSFFIIFTETQWGWTGVKDNPKLAISKVLFVVIASLTVSYPITIITYRLNRALLFLFDNHIRTNALKALFKKIIRQHKI